MTKRTIVYISGEGRSGTTLLDAILGNQEKAFSAGELVFFAEKGIKNKEYCACGCPVPDCELWSRIIKKWDEKRTLHLDEYIEIQKQLTSKKNVFASWRALKNPTKRLSEFLDDTQALYGAIFDSTGSSTIIDSSKAPGKIPILKKMDYDIKVLHVTRRFGDVLNSYKKDSSKNLKEGVEHDIVPLSTSYVLTSWVTKNLLSYFFSAGIYYKRIKYENLVTNPTGELSMLTNGNRQFAKKLKQRGPFFLKHLVAGNKLRMKDHIYIANKPMNTTYKRLHGADRTLAKFMDFFY